LGCARNPSCERSVQLEVRYSWQALMGSRKLRVLNSESQTVSLGHCLCAHSSLSSSSGKHRGDGNTAKQAAMRFPNHGYGNACLACVVNNGIFNYSIRIPGYRCSPRLSGRIRPMQAPVDFFWSPEANRLRRADLQVAKAPNLAHVGVFIGKLGDYSGQRGCMLDDFTVIRKPVLARRKPVGHTKHHWSFALLLLGAALLVLHLLERRITNNDPQQQLRNSCCMLLLHAAAYCCRSCVLAT
jgi:hypothetical protein